MDVVTEMRKLELCKEQGTDDWLAIREGMFTASDISAILGMGGGNYNSVVSRKLGLKESFYGSSWILDRGGGGGGKKNSCQKSFHLNSAKKRIPSPDCPISGRVERPFNITVSLDHQHLYLYPRLHCCWSNHLS